MGIIKNMQIIDSEEFETVPVFESELLNTALNNPEKVTEETENKILDEIYEDIAKDKRKKKNTPKL